MDGQQALPVPRVIEVQKFAGAREQEIRALTAAVKAGSEFGGPKYGAAALPRHLRRRTGSHNLYTHRRRPNAKLQHKRQRTDAGPKLVADSTQGSALLAAAGAKQPGQQQEQTQQPAPPAEAYTNRRMRRRRGRLQAAFQQAAVWDAAALVSSNAGGPSPAEATEAVGEQAAAPAAADGGAPQPAVAGTKPGGAAHQQQQIKQQRGQRQQQQDQQQSQQRPAPHRLETHTWHAKRVAMAHRWGWVLPEGAAGAGKGSRSFAHQIKGGAVMHDASYHCPLLLRCPTLAELRQVVGSVLPPPDAAAVLEDWSGSCGSRGPTSGTIVATSTSSSSSWQAELGWEVQVMLHHPGQYPRGAICPARVMCFPGSRTAGGTAQQQPQGQQAGPRGPPQQAEQQAWQWPVQTEQQRQPSEDHAIIDGMQVDTPAATPAVAAAAAEAAAPAVQRPASEQAPGLYQLCLWVHAAAAAEVHGALGAALDGASAPPGPPSQAEAAGAGPVAAEGGREAAATVGAAGGSSLEVLDLRRVEVRGGGGSAALVNALRGFTCQQQQQQGVGGASVSLLLPAPLGRLEDGEAACLLLPDPRLLKPVTLGSAGASLLPPGAAAPAPAAATAQWGARHGGLSEQLQGQQGHGQQASQQPGAQATHPLQQPPVACPHAPDGLLSPGHRVPGPLPEAEVSSWRQQARKDLLQLGSVGAPGSKQQHPMQQQQSAGYFAAADKQLEARGTHCPAVLLRHAVCGAHDVPGWSLVLPAGWVPPFWLALAFAGCRPVGQREWHWLHTLQQRPFFPADYPDTQAYVTEQGHLQSEQARAAARQPKGKRAPPGPPLHPPPWEQLVPPTGGRDAAGPASRPGRAAGVAAAAEVEVAAVDTAAAASHRAEGAAGGACEAMEVDQPPGQGPPPPGAGQRQQLQQPEAEGHTPAHPTPPAAAPLVARTLDDIADILWGDGSSSSNSSHGWRELSAPSARPVANALRASELQWRLRLAGTSSSTPPAAARGLWDTPAGLGPPVGSGGTASGSSTGTSGDCLVEVTVHPIKAGTAAEGASICYLLGSEAQFRKQPLYLEQGGPQQQQQEEEEQEQEQEQQWSQVQEMQLEQQQQQGHKQGQAREDATPSTNSGSDVAPGEAGVPGAEQEAAVGEAAAGAEDATEGGEGDTGGQEAGGTHGELAPAFEAAIRQDDDDDDGDNASSGSMGVMGAVGPAQHAKSKSNCSSPAAAVASPARSSNTVSEGQLMPIGSVTSQVPRGAPKSCGSVGLVSAAALWRLRSLQYYRPRRDGGAVLALVRNPRSSAVHPVRLRLLVEHPGA